jgi:acyl-CoA thioesterase I
VRRNFLIRFVAASLSALLACLAPASGSASGVDAGKTQKSRPVVLVVGDSLSAEYGLPRGSGWVQLLAERLRDNGSNYTVVNASISGDTTSGGRSRLPALLKQHAPEVLIIELGGNDGLRGLPLGAMRDNLAAMIRMGKSAGARVLLVGIQIPPNYGREYTERFSSTYQALADEHKVALVPVLLDGFGESLDYFQADRIHPTAQAQPRMLDNVWPALRPLLSDRPGK